MTDAPFHDMPADAPRHLQFLARSIVRSVPLSSVVAEKVELRRQGSELCGRSPFIDSIARQFFVNDELGKYHCFATKRSGDVIRFVMETEGKTFAEAVTALAPRLGIRTPL